MNVNGHYSKNPNPEFVRKQSVRSYPIYGGQLQAKIGKAELGPFLPFIIKDVDGRKAQSPLASNTKIGITLR